MSKRIYPLETISEMRKELLEGKTYKEIGRVRGMSMNTAWRLLNRVQPAQKDNWEDFKIRHGRWA